MKRSASKVAEEPLGVTLTVDGWSNCRMESIMGVNVVLGSTRQSILWDSKDMSAESHTGERMAEFITKQIKALEGPLNGHPPAKRVTMLCTDQAANMRKSRELVVKTEGLTHIQQMR